MKKRRDKKKRKDEKCERRSINRGMLPVQECRRNVSCGGGGGEGRIKASVEFDFRRLSSEEQVNEMVSCFFHLRVKFVRVSVFTARCWWTSDVQRTSVTREEAVHLPCRILSQGEQRAPREGMSAVIPKRGMLLYRLDKRYDTRGATIIAIEWLFVLLKGPFTLRKRTV